LSSERVDGGKYQGEEKEGGEKKKGGAVRSRTIIIIVTRVPDERCPKENVGNFVAFFRLRRFIS
jgi:hypothetical protein